MSKSRIGVILLQRTLPYLPFLTVLVAVGGLLFAIYQFQTQQGTQQNRMIAEQEQDRASREREQLLKSQKQVRDDVEELLQFPSKRDMTVSRVGFLLSDLKAVAQVAQGSSNSNVASLVPTREITNNLIETIKTDCDFSSKRDLDFALEIAVSWDDYLDVLRDEKSSRSYILDKYITALFKLHTRSPNLFRSLEYNSENSQWEGDDLDAYIEDLRFFDSLQEGFILCLKLEEDHEVSSDYVRQFQDATCNKTLTKQLLGETSEESMCSK